MKNPLHNFVILYFLKEDQRNCVRCLKRMEGNCSTLLLLMTKIEELGVSFNTEKLRKRKGGADSTDMCLLLSLRTVEPNRPPSYIMRSKVSILIFSCVLFTTQQQRWVCTEWVMRYLFLYTSIVIIFKRLHLQKTDTKIVNYQTFYYPNCL